MNSKWSLPIIIFTAAAMSFMTFGCEPPAPTVDEEPEVDEEPGVDEDDFALAGDPQAGQEIYERQCVSCHGAEGDGLGPAGAHLDPPPGDFTRSELSPAETFEVIRDGGVGTGRAATMPAFGDQLDEQELHDVTAYTLEFIEE